MLCIVLFVGYGLYTMKLNMGSKAVQSVEGYVPVPDSFIEELDKLPVQSGGRVKPYSTWSKFLMYQLHGSASMKIEVDGEQYKMGASEVVYHCLFNPELASELQLFRVEDKNILTSLEVEDPAGEVSGMLESKNRRDRYSYTELRILLPSLVTKAEAIYELDKKLWDNEQRQTVNLTDSLVVYMGLNSQFSYTREAFPPLPGMKSETARLSDWLEKYDLLLQSIQQIQAEKGKLPEATRQLWKKFELVSGKASNNIYLIPPVDSVADGVEEEKWSTVGAELTGFLQKEHKQPELVLKYISLTEHLVEQLESEQFEEAQSTFSELNAFVFTSLDDTLKSRLSSEVSYTRKNYFFKALVFLFPALLLVLVSWVVPPSARKVSSILRYGI